MALSITSTAFKDGKRIPKKYTCESDDISPALAWSDVPPEAKSLALIMDDPDAPMGVFTHWVLFNLPPDLSSLDEGQATGEKLDNGAIHGINDFGRTGYGGPCPPPGPTHRYFFAIYALDTSLGLKPRSTKQQLLTAMKGHVLTEARLVGTYSR